MSSLAAEIIEEAYRRPRHRGFVPNYTHQYEDENPLCGDVIRVQLRVENGQVTEAKFDGRGCAISQASAELLLNRIAGVPVGDVLRLGKDEMLEELELPEIAPARLKCALLPLGAVKRALEGGGGTENDAL
jgi:nitrogen fixation protein NifU and related proteins